MFNLQTKIDSLSIVLGFQRYYSETAQVIPFAFPGEVSNCFVRDVMQDNQDDRRCTASADYIGFYRSVNPPNNVINCSKLFLPYVSHLFTENRDIQYIFLSVLANME